MTQYTNYTLSDVYQLDTENQFTQLCGFPLIKLPKLKLAIQILPVTKVQFEYFLCDQPDASFNETTYNELIQLNPRVSPLKIVAENYWNVFITGLQPEEISKYAMWLGDGFKLPTKEQWHQVYTTLSVPADEDLVNQVTKLPGIPERSKIILQKLDEVSQQLSAGRSRQLADQLFLRNGVMEWVTQPDPKNQWGGMGAPLPRFHNGQSRIDQNVPEILLSATNYRLKYYGFRLVKRLG